MFHSTPNHHHHHQLSVVSTPIAPQFHQQQQQNLSNNFYTNNNNNNNNNQIPPSVSHTPQGPLLFSSRMNSTIANSNTNNTSTMSATPSAFINNYNNNSQQQQQNFLLVVNTVDGKKYKLVSKNDIRRLTSTQIKRFIKMVAGIPENVQVLRFAGKILADSDVACIGDAVGVENGDVIALDDLRMYSNNDQVQRLQQHNLVLNQTNNNNNSNTSSLQQFYSGNPAHVNGPPESLQDLARGAGGLPSSTMAMKRQQNNNNNKNIRGVGDNSNEGIFHSNQEQVIMQPLYQQQQQASLRSSSNLHQQSPVISMSSSLSASPNQSQHQQQQQPQSQSMQAATSIIEMQKRLLQKEMELSQQQESLQKMLQLHHQERTMETKKLLDDSIQASQQNTKSEMSQIREEIKRVEALQVQQQQQQQNYVNSNNNNNNLRQISPSMVMVNESEQQQLLSPRGSALLASQSSFSNYSKRPPAPPSVKQQPTSNNGSGVFTPRNETAAAAVESPNSSLIQDAMRIANNNNNLASSSSFYASAPPSPPKRVPTAFKNLPLRDKAFNLVIFAIKKLLLLSYISPDVLNGGSEIFSKDSDTWTVDLINQSKLAQQQLFLQHHQQQQIINPAEEESGAVNSILFSFDEDSSRIYVYTTLLHFIPQHDPLLKLALYEMLLEGALMGREMVGGGVGVSAKSNLVLMATSIDVRHCGDEEALGDVVGEFVDSAQSWSRACMQVLQQHGTRRSAAF